MTTAASDEPANRTFDERLGEAIHQVLWRRRIKQTEFAEQVLGITQSALSSKLRGRRPFFAGELSLIASALDMEVAELLPRTEVQPPPTDPNPPGRSAPTRARTWDLRI
ncbi:helix-turn-helix domain-containing protein, partial [Mycobacterium avium]